MTARLTVIALALVLAVPSLTTADASRLSCRDFFMDPTVITRENMIQVGCTDETRSGMWKAAPGYCAKRARQLARRGFRGERIEQIAYDKYGCGINPNGVWEGVSHIA